MSRCPSCDRILSDFELTRTLELEDGTLVPEPFCTSCLTEYVYNADDLEVKEYQHQHLTDIRYKNFKEISE